MTKDYVKAAIAYNLFCFIKERGMTQVELAQRSGVSEAAISRYINGERVPDVFTLDKIACVLNCTIDDFLRT